MDDVIVQEFLDQLSLLEGFIDVGDGLAYVYFTDSIYPSEFLGYLY